MRRNGHPVIEVNVTDEQMEDAIDLALQFVRRTPEENPWNGYRLKLAAAAFVRQQWALNLMKYHGMELLGGLKINAVCMYNMAKDDLRDLPR